MSGAALDPAAHSARRLGLFGGSFDPPHLGHLHVARAARETFDLDHVVFVPAGQPPHKPGRRLAPGPIRVEMLGILLAEVPWASVWEAELERSGPSYTVDTLEALREHVGPEPELYVLIGQDNLADLPGWHRVEAMLTLAQPVIVQRAGSDWSPPRLSELHPRLVERIERGRIQVPPLEISSSEVRAGEGVPEERVPPELWEYLRRRGLYGVGR